HGRPVRIDGPSLNQRRRSLGSRDLPNVLTEERMSAHVHLIRGPAASGKTSLLLDAYRRSVAQAPGSALWLGPTPRAVDAARSRLTDGGALVGVRLMTFAEFFHDLVRRHDPAARSLSDVQRRLLLQDVVRELAAQGRLSHFGRVLDTRGF